MKGGTKAALTTYPVLFEVQEVLWGQSQKPGW